MAHFIKSLLRLFYIRIKNRRFLLNFNNISIENVKKPRKITVYTKIYVKIRALSNAHFCVQFYPIILFIQKVRLLGNSPVKTVIADLNFSRQLI